MNKKVLWIFLIAILASGIWVAMSDRVGGRDKGEPPVAGESGVGAAAEQISNSIDLVRPPFLDD